MKNFFLLSLLFILSCSTTKMVELKELEANEALIVGKIVLDNNYWMPKDKLLVYFKERFAGTSVVGMNEGGYFQTSLPQGKNFISRIEYQAGLGFFRNIPENVMLVDITEPGKVYYIGDIYFRWKPSEKDERKQRGTGAVIGGLVGAAIEEGVQAKMEANRISDVTPTNVTINDTTLQYFQQKLQNHNIEIIVRPITVDQNWTY